MTSLASRNGATALHWGAAKGQTMACRRILMQEADANARDRRALSLYFSACWHSQRTPLHWASGNGQTQTVKELLFWGAQAGLIDGKQKLALHWACFRGHIDTAEELIKQVTASFAQHTPNHVLRRASVCKSFSCTAALSEMFTVLHGLSNVFTGSPLDVRDSEGHTPGQLFHEDTPPAAVAAVERLLQSALAAAAAA
eukprot:16885-Heterococcus_DN1.PRE.1